MWWFIVCCGRVPASDSCIAWQISSPQIFESLGAQETFISLDLEDIYILVVAELEQIELQKYNELALKKLKTITAEAHTTGDLIFAPYKIESKKFPHEIDQQNEQLSKQLHKQIEERSSFYPKAPSNVRLTKQELQVTIEQTITIAKDFINVNKMSYLWSFFQVEQGSYQKLAEKLLSRIFSKNILEPLEDLSKRVRIKQDKSSEFCKIINYIQGDHKALQAKFITYDQENNQNEEVKKIPAPQLLQIDEMIFSMSQQELLRFSPQFQDWVKILLFPVNQYKELQEQKKNAIQIINQ